MVDFKQQLKDKKIYNCSLIIPDIKNIDYQTTILKDNTSKEIALLASTSLIQKEGEKRLLL